MTHLARRPSLPIDLSHGTGMRLSHVSRALGELLKEGKVQRLGRLYAITPEGIRTLGLAPRVSPEATPLVRGGHIQHAVDYFRESREEAHVEEFLRDRGLEEPLDYNSWTPLALSLQFNQGLEDEFGDGTYAYLAHVASVVVPRFKSVRMALLEAPSIEDMTNRLHLIYLQEFNHGRIEVQAKETQVLLTAHHWITSPARCAAWGGSIRGLLRMLGLQGKVHEISCFLVDAGPCRYLISFPNTD